MSEITPEVFNHGMGELLSCCKNPSISEEDRNIAIFEGAILMCAVLSQIGYRDGAEFFIEMCRIASHSRDTVIHYN